MPHVNAYLIFDGTCAAAMRDYHRVLGGSLAVMTFADAPADAQMPPGSEERVMHARLEMPMQPTFWAKQFGMLVDRHGVSWMVHC
jgi:PhnB protein